MVPVQELSPRTKTEAEQQQALEDASIALVGLAQNLQERQPVNDELANVNIESTQPIIKPIEVVRKYPLSERAKETVRKSRLTIEDIITDPTTQKRLIAVVGPCSINDSETALEYAQHVAKWRELFGDKLEIVMRTYLEKPRTTVGWEGFIEDPDYDETYDKDKGLLLSRKLICDVNDIGVPAATELVNTATPQYIDDGISLGAIGARTVESQLHRKLGSAVSFAVGFKNGTGGSLQIAVDAVVTARHRHYMDGINPLGQQARFKTYGNQHGFIILRGSNRGTNFDAETIQKARELLAEANITPAIMIDCSHKNKIGEDQRPAVAAVAQQVAAGDASIIGVMIESNLVAGKQERKLGTELIRGQSVTDYCEDTETTQKNLELLYESVTARQNLVP